MSILNVISNEEVTLVQSVDGPFLCEESWTSRERSFLPEECHYLKLLPQAECTDKGAEQTSPQETDGRYLYIDGADLIEL